jgi:hypothetical protein
MFNPNQAFLLVQKLKSTPRAFTLGVKAELEKIFSICLNLLINVELYNLVLAPRLRKGYPANLQPFGPIFTHLLMTRCQCFSIY